MSRATIPPPLPRRALTVTLAWALAWALTSGAPMLFAATLVIDLVRRRRWAASRFLTFLFVLAWAEAIGATFALLIGRDPDRNYALQREWSSVLAHAAFAIWSIRFEVEGEADLSSGPFVLLCRHATLADTLLPMLLAALPYGLAPRYVLKQELRWDPCLDIVGGRVPNVFVDRELGDAAREGDEEARREALVAAEAQRAALTELAAGADARSFLAIYPEGTRATPARRARILARLTGEDRAAAERLQHVLPARPGGFLALLEGSPEADVVIVAHAGMEGSARLPDLLAGSIVGATWRVRATRHARASIPEDRDGRVAWLRARWEEVDAWVGEPG